jgi:hypothetical protein
MVSTIITSIFISIIMNLNSYSYICRTESCQYHYDKCAACNKFYRRPNLTIVYGHLGRYCRHCLSNLVTEAVCSSRIHCGEGDDCKSCLFFNKGIDKECNRDIETCLNCHRLYCSAHLLMVSDIAWYCHTCVSLDQR